MKILFTIFLTFIALQSFSQDLESLFEKRKLPEGLTVSIENVSYKFPDFPKPYSAIVTFSYGSRSVYYFVYEYELSDSAAFEFAQESYWMVSGCTIEFNKDFNKNFTTFLKQDYLFLLQRCACKTRENADCAELAEKINMWSE